MKTAYVYKLSTNYPKFKVVVCWKDSYDSYITNGIDVAAVRRLVAKATRDRKPESIHVSLWQAE